MGKIHFKEEIQPGEALGGASGSVSPPCVHGKLLAMIQGEVWELIWVNQRMTQILLFI